MLCLLGVMLSVLCLVSPAPLTTATARARARATATAIACPTDALLKETIQDLRRLSSKGSSKITPLNNTVEEGGNAAIYLEGFIEALKKESVEQKLVAQLQRIQAYGESCTGWMSAFKEHRWKAEEEDDFFSNLEDLLRFLGDNTSPAETN